MNSGVIVANTMNMFWLAGNGLYTFNSLALFQQKSPSRYQRTLRACPVTLTANQAGENVLCPQPDVPIAEFGTLEWSVYGQDEFQATDRLTITAGVRVSGLEFQDDPQRVPSVEAAFTIPGHPMTEDGRNSSGSRNSSSTRRYTTSTRSWPSVVRM